MIEKILLGLAVLAIGMGMTPTLAEPEPPSPLSQWKQGVPFGLIQCADMKILVESPSGKPACVTEDTSVKMTDRGWQVVESAIDSDTTYKLVTLDSSELDKTPNIEPFAYGYPTVDIRYPEQMRVGGTYSIFFNYTFADVPHIDQLDETILIDLGFTFHTGIEVLNEDMTVNAGSPTAKGYPDLEFTIYRASKVLDIDPRAWHQYEIKFKVNEAPKPRSGIFSTGVWVASIQKWLEHDNGILTVIDSKPDFTSGSDGVIRANDPYRDKAIAVVDPDIPNRPPMDALADFLENHILPITSDMRQYLQNNTELPHDYIDELLAAYPQLDTQGFGVGGQASPSFFFRVPSDLS